MKRKQFSKALTFALTQEHYDRIKSITDKSEESIGKWLRAAVAQALEKEREPYLH